MIFGPIGKIFLPYDYVTFSYRILIFKGKFPTCYVRYNINRSCYIRKTTVFYMVSMIFWKPRLRRVQKMPSWHWHNYPAQCVRYFFLETKHVLRVFRMIRDNETLKQKHYYRNPTVKAIIDGKYNNHFIYKPINCVFISTRKMKWI